GDFLSMVEIYRTLVITLIIACFIGIMFTLTRLIFSGTILVIAILVYILISYILFVEKSIIIEMVRSISSFTFTGVLALAYRYFVADKDKRYLKGSFQHYISAEVVDEIIKDPSKLTLGGEKKDITILFSDIRGFTKLSEIMDPQDLVNFLNNYQTMMTAVIFDHKGILDKYIGDAIVALFGAPVYRPDHAERGVQTALKMMERLVEFRSVQTSNYLKTINIGIGINTGEVIIGNMGSAQIFDYTAIGDNMNLASRLEGLNKYYGTNILISNSTREAVSGEFVIREIDMVAVKGRSRITRIYELLGYRDSDDHLMKLCQIFEEAKIYYLNRDWETAIRLFKQVLKLRDDNPSKIFIERCREFKSNPPDEEWAGQWIMSTK
ncbi:MAG: adenylate/guanylate cyclase domain-containing protein, partial [Fidelibacterota bacterium]